MHSMLTHSNNNHSLDLDNELHYRTGSKIVIFSDVAWLQYSDTVGWMLGKPFGLENICFQYCPTVSRSNTSMGPSVTYGGYRKLGRLNKS